MSVLRSAPLDGIPRKMFVDHINEGKRKLKLHFRRMGRPSGTEQKLPKEQFGSLPKEGKIKRSKSPYGALFFS